MNGDRPYLESTLKTWSVPVFPSGGQLLRLCLGLIVLFAVAMTTCWLTAYFFLPRTICLDAEVNGG